MHDGPDSDLEFAATAVAFRLDDALDAEYLVLAERPDGSGRTLEVQHGSRRGSGQHGSILHRELQFHRR